MLLGYIITAQAADKDKEYFAIDRYSGGYLIGPGSIHQLDYFKLLKRPIKHLNPLSLPEKV